MLAMRGSGAVLGEGAPGFPFLIFPFGFSLGLFVPNKLPWSATRWGFLRVGLPVCARVLFSSNFFPSKVILMGDGSWRFMEV